jgi:hypothetical protein
VATPSIQTKLDWLVALCALPATGLVATLLYTELSPGNAFGLPAAGELGGVLWWWGLASAALLVGGLAFAQRLARQITSPRRVRGQLGGRAAGAAVADAHEGGRGGCSGARQGGGAAA